VGSGEKMRFILKTSEQTYSLETGRTRCHSGRTAPSSDVRSECDRGTPFLSTVS
jgi:hypothetical protein